MRLAGSYRRRGRTAIAAILMMAAFSVSGEEYLSRDEFLGLAFGQAEPEMETLWLTGDMREAAEDAVGWAPGALRVRYWKDATRTAWILEHVGKVKPITLGVTVSPQGIERVEVLAFRESRGWEIRYPFFTEQFSGLTLADDGYLSGPVDGITGATLSVRATEKVARLALWLDAQVRG
jgi:hypothetical protein